jgi:hypothetical protein
MTDKIVQFHDKSPRNVTSELYGRRISKLSNRYGLYQGSLDDKKLERRCTLAGTKIHSVIFEGDVVQAIERFNPRHLRAGFSNIPSDVKRNRKKDRRIKRDDLCLFYFDGTAYVTTEAENNDEVTLLNRFREKFYGNVFLMGSMLYLHEDFFGRPAETVVDLFTGKAGTALAGLEYGVQSFLGFEIDLETYTHAERNIRRYLAAKNFEFTLDGDGNSTHYTVEREEGDVVDIRLYRANCITEGPGIVKELELDDFDVVSDIPWGCHKCLAVADKRLVRTRDMDKFHARIGEALVEMGNNRATIALNSHGTLSTLKEIKRITTPAVYDIAMYSPNG